MYSVILSHKNLLNGVKNKISGDTEKKKHQSVYQMWIPFHFTVWGLMSDWRSESSRDISCLKNKTGHREPDIQLVQVPRTLILLFKRFLPNQNWTIYGYLALDRAKSGLLLTFIF